MEEGLESMIKMKNEKSACCSNTFIAAKGKNGSNQLKNAGQMGLQLQLKSCTSSFASFKL